MYLPRSNALALGAIGLLGGVSLGYAFENDGPGSGSLLARHLASFEPQLAARDLDSVQAPRLSKREVDEEWLYARDVAVDHFVNGLHKRMAAKTDKLHNGQATNVGMGQNAHKGPGQAIGTHGLNGCTGITCTHPTQGTVVAHVSPMGHQAEMQSLQAKLHQHGMDNKDTRVHVHSPGSTGPGSPSAGGRAGVQNHFREHFRTHGMSHDHSEYSRQPQVGAGGRDRQGELMVDNDGKRYHDGSHPIKKRWI